jgi:hypothetical protein
MRRKLWIFCAVQCAGCLLVYIDDGPCAGYFLLPGLILLLPGSLIVFALPHLVDNLPQWAGDTVVGVLVICANTLAWYLVLKIVEENRSEAQESQASDQPNRL